MGRRTTTGLIALLLALTATLTACGGQTATEQTATPAAEAPAALSDRGASGEALANAWLELISLTGGGTGEVDTSPEEVQASMAIVRPYLDPAFTLVRATGERYNADTYVPLDIDAYEVSDVVVTEPRDDIRVLRYFVSQPGATAPDSGVVMSSEKAPRIAVLRWDEQLGHWVTVSYANFNTPVAAICDQEPIVVTGETPAVSTEDLELGTSLVTQWRDITTGQSTQRVRHPANQIQLADGQGWPTADGSAISWAPAGAYEVGNIGVTRNGDLLVTSYDAIVSDLVVEGDQYSSTANPRLITYLLSPEGKWELIALANFNVPQGVPAGVDCVAITQ